ncbi:pimeloyl-ACP methyl ester carboxylesterase [Nocardia tenerifensis]|uniref:Pimeloyl-ACP methyl ester carboxylesterase n=1 Tax=Nocardia tenerifensis TaxID=228006 RepID=A0A318KBT7_9NOCA|nr:alpha/beta hydrolase [Nocardia tenerifensis]PXX71778.1 pimeloyl-ACP methyl ester carboxylesterase [Nocardia tenerifensis]
MGFDTISEKRVMVQGLSTSYLEAGTGPVLVLIHGNLTAAQGWDRTIEEFRTTHKVLAPSLPGYGGTSPLRDVTLDGLVSFIAAFLDATSVDTAIVLGHSAGGLIAAQFALENPDRVSRLVLVDSVGLGRAINPVVIAGALLPGWATEIAIAALLLPGGGILRALMRGVQVRRPWRLTVQEWRTQTRIMQAQTLLSTSFQAVRLVVGPAGQRGRYNLVERLGELPMPTLLIWGLTDEVVPFWQGIRAARKIPRARFVPLVSAGHAGYLECHVDFVTALSPFIRDEPDTSGPQRTPTQR